MKKDEGRRKKESDVESRPKERRVLARDRVIILLLVVGVAVVFLRPLVAQQSRVRANSFLECGSNKRAITHYKRALLLNPNSAEVYSVLGFTYLREKQFNKALDAYEKAIELGLTEEQTYAEAGIAALRGKHFGIAAYYSGKAVEINPKNLLAKNVQAVAYEKAGETEKAIFVTKDMLKQDPGFGPAKERLKRLSKKE